MSDVWTFEGYREIEAVGKLPDGLLYRAVHDRTEDKVLLKRIPASQQQENAGASWHELLAETRRLTRFFHPQVSPLLELSEEPEEVVLAIGLPHGTTLRQHLARQPGVDRQTLVRWGKELVRLLAEVHGAEVLHRHLSDQAVVIDTDGAIHLWGLSLTNFQAEDPGLYSPERRQGLPLDPRSDLYSVGRLLERLIERLPVAGGEVSGLHADDPLRAVLLRATAESPEDRYEDAVEMAVDLSEVARWQPPGTNREEPAATTAPASAPTAAPAGAQATTDPEAGSEAGEEAEVEMAPPAAEPAAVVPEAAEPRGEQIEEPPPARSLMGWLAAVLILGLLGAGAWWWNGQRGAAPPDSTALAEVAPEETPTQEPPTEPPPPADAADRIAQQLVEQASGALFSPDTMPEDDKRLLSLIAADLASLDFHDDPFGDETAHSLFGENPLLAESNPLLDAEVRRGWLAAAIRNKGNAMALAHIQQETAKLQSGEITRAEWYEHVTQCTEFCNMVMVGLLTEHVRRVEALPHELVLFGLNEDRVDPETSSRLEDLLSDGGSRGQILLIGRASRIGDREFNRELSQRRVASVRRVVEGLGIAGERVHGFWLGYEPPQINREIAQRYRLMHEALSLEELNQSVLVVAYEPTFGDFVETPAG